MTRRTGRELFIGSSIGSMGRIVVSGSNTGWQYRAVASSNGITILNAVKNTVDSSTQVVYNENPDVNFVKSNKFSYAIVVIGEPPYAETSSDSLNLTISESGPSTNNSVCRVVNCVVVVISARPVVIQPYPEKIDALVAAWLLGTES
ncbi:hypothetical protein LWI28_006060 [Acer negundo]|uniref:beta-glucosidase n=1 Tax=Acer negundo TaxID=4023 RepID=A0AAD5P184_ACENE|nr:hypothetical protein LWI28_006060 [Acer negundo]